MMEYSISSVRDLTICAVIV